MNVNTPDTPVNLHTFKMSKWLKTADDGYFVRLAQDCFEPSPETIRINALGFAKNHASPKVDWPAVDWLSVFVALKSPELKSGEELT